MIDSLYDCFKHWSRTGSVWIYSDTHFGDEGLRKGYPDRPDDEEHLSIINRYVRGPDTFIHLGDVGDISYASRIRGHKVLVLGNHDHGASKYRGVFDEVYAGPLWIAPKIVVSHERIDLPFAFCIHGHEHEAKDILGPNHMNLCSDACGYRPASLGAIIKSGYVDVPSIHRMTIDNARERKRERESQ